MTGASLAEPTDNEFAAPNKMSNLILKIGDKKLHVSKEISKFRLLLALYSPVFEAMFFGDSEQKGKDEVEINDEFVDLLHSIYHGQMKDGSVLHLLKLAVRFQMEVLLEQAKILIMRSRDFSIMKKLLVADQYNLADLKEECLNSFCSVVELQRNVKASPEYDNLSMAMKSAVCDRMMKLQ
ncbi:hypothetical protein PRIPAC_86042 [Pristionchus pacificus]|uniref:BTB domain-containing protein n=1 Tax=Pristionchus pacificus TaxID=54126 RepID=A0A2A6CER5_PRIPA|nr:hypothetical protein PRIPAC_86042 [Pristionchus pacificus]|eukprot:PDM76619.1 BTB domain-containing protein [Pristionchus pacificus]